MSVWREKKRFFFAENCFPHLDDNDLDAACKAMTLMLIKFLTNGTDFVSPVDAFVALTFSEECSHLWDKI